MSANIDQYQWVNRPQVPGSLTQRISISDRGGNLYKWDSTLGDWAADTSPATPTLSAAGQIAASALPATVLASATITLAALTGGGGSQGSITIVNGLVTAYDAPS